MNTFSRSCCYLLLVMLSVIVASPAQGERLKDLAGVAGVRTNELIGYGFVVGLDGTGDQTTQAKFTLQSLKNMLNQLGVNVPPDQNPQLKNVAAVMVTATLPPFSKPGQRIDITISSIANAKSLRGGTLLMTPLKGADGNVYAVAQGSLVVGGFGVAGADGSKITVNIPSVGRIPNGALVERTVPDGFNQGNSLVLNLHNADFTTAYRLAEAVNKMMGPGTAQAIDAVSVSVLAPMEPAQRVAYVSVLENIDVTPAEPPARIIVNSRTGTVVIGSHVRVLPTAVSHGSLTVTITETPQVSQPAPLSDGQTVVVPRSNIQVSNEDRRMFLLEPGVTLNEVVRAVNAVGAAPGDLMAILEALKQAGALRAELIVI